MQKNLDVENILFEQKEELLTKFGLFEKD